MPIGVIFAFLAYASFSVGDALIKATGPALSVFEIGFFTITLSIIPAVLTTRDERWRDLYKLRHPWLVHIRCATAIGGTACVMYAFTHIPFADVYAIGFLTPVVVTILGVLLLKEHVAIHRWLLLIISFLGVVLVIRPGVRDLQLGHLAILCSVFFGGVTTIILRHVAPHERRVSLVGLQVLYSAIFNGVLMLPGFVMPSLHQLLLFLGIGLVGGTGGLLLIAAARRTPANLVAPVQYSQLIWAIVFGALFFGEYPDWIAIVGLLIVLTSGLANVMTEKLKIVWKPRLFFFRTGL
ncbi:DMT family transporter [Devosia sp. FKR38]|uniref:DMT family transporter n=1 Tax=Devosia sp. FKR38 TaxID=2562312 RepID=UPI0010BF726A|nr:DMT family transporter [Devosia sp. FKR38]